MADDPYNWPGTEILRNKLGIRDDGALRVAEQWQTAARGLEAARLSFAPTADGYRALHKHLFQDIYDWAGQNRTVIISKAGSTFASPHYIGRSLDKLFADMTTRNGFRELSRDEFFDRLGNHISELNAIHPFREGNGRTMRHHADQVAREAGHPIRMDAIDKAGWMQASRHSFLTGDHRGMSAALAAAAARRDSEPDARIGPAGIALLPERAPPEGQRYRVTLAKAREELDRHLPLACRQASDRLHALTKDGASSTAVDHARTELAYLRHPKGPVYQSHVLDYLGIRQVDAVITKDQTPLDRVREIGAAIGVQIRSHQQQHVQRAVRSLEHQVIPPGHPLGQERLATLFLKNDPDKNRADPRLAAAQQVVDAAVKAAQRRDSNTHAIEAISEAARKQVAGQIRSGEPPAYSAPVDRPAVERKPPERGR